MPAPKILAPTGTKPQHFCSKCNKTMSEDKFYTYKDGSKCELCKACLTMHVNNFEPNTFLWLLEKFDVPYIEAEWNVLRDRAYAKDPHKMNGMSVFGRYLAKMKLKQFSSYTWADTDRLAEKARQDALRLGTPEEQKQQQLEEMKEMFEAGAITEAQYKTYAEINAPTPSPEVTTGQPPAEHSIYPDNNPFEEVEIDVGNDLTEEDKKEMAIKWGRLYRPHEWVQLEQLYTDFMNSFDIQGAARIDTLKMICKTSLKMNQAIDCGDVEAYQKLSRVYDAMMKAAKFTEAQNKEGKSDFLNSACELVAYCEKNGGQIPKYEIKVPYDIVDKIIEDLKGYNKSLIYEDKSLAEEIEQYLKKKEIAEEMKRSREEAREKGLDYVEVGDEDYEEFQNAIADDIAHDEALIAEGA